MHEMFAIVGQGLTLDLIITSFANLEWAELFDILTYDIAFLQFMSLLMQVHFAGK